MSNSHIVNVEVKLRPQESTDRLIKRFLKKCKKQDIIKEYLSKVSFYQTRSQKVRAKRARNKYLRNFEKL